MKNIEIGFSWGWRFGPLGPYPKFVSDRTPFFAHDGRVYRNSQGVNLTGCIYVWQFGLGPFIVRRRA